MKLVTIATIRKNLRQNGKYVPDTNTIYEFLVSKGFKPKKHTYLVKTAFASNAESEVGRNLYMLKQMDDDKKRAQQWAKDNTTEPTNRPNYVPRRHGESNASLELLRNDEAVGKRTLLEYYYGNPDNISCDGYSLRWTSEDAVTFGYFPVTLDNKYKFFSSSQNEAMMTSHYDLACKAAYELIKGRKNSFNPNEFNHIVGCVLDKGALLGRCWMNAGVISFWTPFEVNDRDYSHSNVKPSDLVKVLNDLGISENEYSDWTLVTVETGYGVTDYVYDPETTLANSKLEMYDPSYKMNAVWELKDSIWNKIEAIVSPSSSEDAESSKRQQIDSKLGNMTYAQYRSMLYQENKKPKTVKITEEQYSRLFDRKKTIKLTQEQVNRLLKVNEGVDWSLSPNGTINMSINQRKDNNSNRGGNSVDTRVFGTKDDILNGKILNKTGGETNRSKSLAQNYVSKNAAMRAYKNVVQWIENGRTGQLELPQGLDQRTITSIKSWIDGGHSDNRIIDACKKSMNRIAPEVNQTTMTYNRVANSNDENVARYLTGIVPNTDVKYISLFSMTDFNFSDAIKHGKIRQNGNTDKLLGINGDNERERDAQGNLNLLDITYDDGIKPNIAQNFSLNGVKDMHYRQQYGLNGGGEYSSVAQFLDKSVNYASYALKKEKFIPDFIVSAPSSSNFNKFYCQNLSNKLGVKYIDDFFKRNVINIRYADGNDLLSKGFSPKDVMEFESQAKNVAYNEIGYIVSAPIRKLIYNNQDIFGNIAIEKHSREKVSISDVFDCTMIYAYQTIIDDLQNDVVSEHLVKNFLKEKNKLYAKSYDSKRIFSEVSFRIKMKIGQKVFNAALMETKNLVLKYSDVLKERGYRLKFNLKQFKITSFKKMFRPFLSNMYIIADNYLNNGELMGRFRNAKFLIFDEDINSGATLKIVIDALREKLPEQNSDNLMCLVNAYSGSGF